MVASNTKNEDKNKNCYAKYNFKYFNASSNLTFTTKIECIYFHIVEQYLVKKNNKLCIPLVEKNIIKVVYIMLARKNNRKRDGASLNF